MRTDKLTLGFSYLRLSNEEAQNGESSSITNQRMMIENYCRQNGIKLVREFSDDGYSGGNFDRPAFQEMMRHLQEGAATAIGTQASLFALFALLLTPLMLLGTNAQLG